MGHTYSLNCYSASRSNFLSFNMSLRFDWQTTISQLACADKTYYSFDLHFLYNSKLFTLHDLSLTEGARMIVQKQERQTLQIHGGLPHFCWTLCTWAKKIFSLWDTLILDQLCKTFIHIPFPWFASAFAICFADNDTEVSWCFEPSQPQSITSGLNDTEMQGSYPFKYRHKYTMNKTTSETGKTLLHENEWLFFKQ